jgi:hypothetical protein
LENNKVLLKKEDFLTRDARVVKRNNYGGKKREKSSRIPNVRIIFRIIFSEVIRGTVAVGTKNQDPSINNINNSFH